VKVSEQIDSRLYAAHTIMLAMAGDIAADLAMHRRSPTRGCLWRMSRAETTAYHEAGHAVMAVATGRYCYRLNIRERAIDGAVVPGSCWSGYLPAAVALVETRAVPDEVVSHDYAALLCGEDDSASVAATIKPIRAKARRILWANFRCLEILARGLLAQETLEQSEIEQICEKHMRLIVATNPAKDSAAVACAAMTPRC
jgi:hypothetical protein